ncbi:MULTISPECIES: extensin family protein [Rhodopseudomonas]|uniref:Extensin n=1 Tax=Rhodopseudomonas palustris TaxID=1076 RepID=A0A0D7EDS6_RHOPL|nr:MULTISPECIES: extensin family protein [Rhodopseudomonas]KIZ38893.1 extensin [Rhodopseudomonas palustris]MDF3812847.1 extensin family protein [Rhodopseudomonas sp. BAL398]WOK18301.1 extensin family protein [Rhodopseudomonas sp. BAL398]
MTRGVRLYLVGSLVLVSLAGCGRGMFQTAEREPWRAEAEVACLKSGAVKETAELVRIDPISGPGVCGAEFPLKVAALGESNASYGFADELRPPAAIGRNQPRWPGAQPPLARPVSSYPQTQYPEPVAGAGSGPVSLNAPGVVDNREEIALPAEGPGSLPRSPYESASPYPADRNDQPARQASPMQYPMPNDGRAMADPVPRLGPAQGNVTSAVGPVALKPVATLACPIVSALDRWLAEGVQPAAMRWFGVRVVEIKQISAYSCRGMNGNSRAHISEHAFGNALDVAGFTLADGRHISVKKGWKGLPEEQGFLRDVQGTACQVFNTVLAPGSNVYHYDHIHVDLMRRKRRRVICQPAAVSGEEVAARAQHNNPYAGGFSGVTGALGARKALSYQAVPGEDGSDDE